MDALRHTAKGTLAALTGPGAAGDDAAQLTDQLGQSAVEGVPAGRGALRAPPLLHRPVD